MASPLIPTPQELREIEARRQHEKSIVAVDPNLSAVGESIAQQVDPGMRSQVVVGDLSEARQLQKQDCDEIWESFRTLGIRPATICNMHPWQLLATGPAHEGRILPACPIGQDFVTYVFEAPYIEASIRENSVKYAHAWPIQLARDFLNQHDWGQGGIFIYEGRHAPGAMWEGRRKPDANAEMADMRAARDRQIKWYQSLVEEGNSRADAKDARQHIGSRHREAARYLFHFKFLMTLPSWVSQRAAGNTAITICAKCGEEVNPKGFACAKCGYITDPYKAYELGELDEEMPGGLLALRRLSKDQLETLNLYPRIKPLAERDGKPAKKAGKEATP